MLCTCWEEASFVQWYDFLENLSGHVVRARTSLLTWSKVWEREKQTDRQTLFHVPVLYTAQWLLDNFPDVLLILKCLASKNYCVTIVLASNNMWKAKIVKVKRLKLDLVRIFKIFYGSPLCAWHLWRQIHTGLRLHHRVFGGKIYIL